MTDTQIPLDDGEETLWQGGPAQPLPAPPRTAYLINTLASAAGIGAFWVMVPDLPLLQDALLLPIAGLIFMAFWPLLTARRRARQLMADTRYTLTNKRALITQPGRTTALPLGPDTLINSGTPPGTITIWNQPRPQPLRFQQLENPEEPYRILKNILGAAP